MDEAKRQGNKAGKAWVGWVAAAAGVWVSALGPAAAANGITFYGPVVSGDFDPPTIPVTGTSRYTVSVRNWTPNTLYYLTPYTIYLPAGLTNVRGVQWSDGCPAYSLSDTPTTITFNSNFPFPPNYSTCTAVYEVKAQEPGSYPVSIPLNTMQTTTGTNITDATATLTVQPAQGVVQVSSYFDPPMIPDTGTSRYTVSVTNPSSNTLYYSTPYTIPLPAGLTNLRGVQWSAGCPAYSLSDTPTTITFNSNFGFPPNSTCTAVYEVKAAAGSYPVSIAPNTLQTSVGTNGTDASATLTVQPAQGVVQVSSYFDPPMIPDTGTSRYTVSVTNPSSNALYYSTPYTIPLPSGLTNLRGVQWSAGCPAYSLSDTPTTITFNSNFGFPPNSTCTAVYEVKAAAGAYPVSIAPNTMQTSVGTNGTDASAILTVQAAGAASSLTLTGTLAK